MAAAPTKKTSDILDIRYNLSTPQGMITAANENVHRVMPKVNMDNYHNSLGVLETGDVAMDLPQPVQLKVRKKKKTISKTKRKKSKNTHKLKGKKER